MRKVLGVLVVGVLAALGAAPRADAALVTINPASQTVGVGDTVTIDLVVSGLIDTIGGFSAVLSFDPATLSGVSVVADPDAYFDNLLDFSEGFGAGTLDLFLIGAPEQFLAGFTLATATFRALSAGIAVLTLSGVELSDELGEVFLTPDTIGGTVTAVPEPALLSLVVLGLASLLARRWPPRGAGAPATRFSAWWGGGVVERGQKDTGPSDARRFEAELR